LVKTSDSGAELATILGHEGIFEGKISVKHSIRIDGSLKGELTTTESLTVGREGVIEGNVNAKHLISGGRIKGTVVVSGKTVLEETSELAGDLKTSKLVIEEGAVLQGKTDMSPPVLKSAGVVLEKRGNKATLPEEEEEV